MHKSVKPPMRRGHCGGKKLYRHGCYKRYLSGLKEAHISIARFICSDCSRTMSCLPAFTFPYRVVQAKTVEKYFNGEEDAEVRKWAYLLETYKKRFKKRTQLIFSLMLEFIVGLSSREPTSEILWQEFI